MPQYGGGKDVRKMAKKEKKQKAQNQAENKQNPNANNEVPIKIEQKKRNNEQF